MLLHKDFQEVIEGGVRPVSSPQFQKETVHSPEEVEPENSRLTDTRHCRKHCSANKGIKQKATHLALRFQLSSLFSSLNLGMHSPGRRPKDSSPVKRHALGKRSTDTVFGSFPMKPQGSPLTALTMKLCGGEAQFTFSDSPVNRNRANYHQVVNSNF